MVFKPTNVDNDVWDVVWRNVDMCFGSNPTNLLHTINGRFTQHYAAVNPIDNLVGHVVGVADGAVPHLILSKSVDIEDRTYSSSFIMRILRNYPDQLTVRKTTGLFGRSWSSPVLEMTVSVSDNTVRLIEQRQEFIFTRVDDNDLYSNHHLLSDRIRINKTAIIYTSSGISYIFDTQSGLLTKITNENEMELISITHNVNNVPVRLTHHSSDSTINVVYGSNGFISSTELSKSGIVLSRVYYSYNDDGYLIRVAGDSVTEYQYDWYGDLSLIIQGQGRTAITYDTMNLMARTVDYFRDVILLELQIHRFCDGSVESTILPQKLSSLFVFGLRGELIEISPENGLPVNIQHDNVRNKVYATVGDELKQTHSLERSSLTYSIANANDEKLVIKLGPNGRVISIGDSESAYYNVTYSGNLVSSVSFRDGMQQKFTYNDQGQRTSATQRDGSQITYSYDDNRRVSFIETSSGRYVYSHNSNGLLTAVSSPDGGTTTLAYDNQGLPISVAYPDGTELKYTYNECDRRSSLTSNTGYNCTYVYDSFCRLSAVVDSSGSTVAAYEYGQHSRIVKKTLSNGMYTEYTYESGSLLLKQLRNFFPNGTLMSYYSYAYNELGHRVETETHEGVWKYRYDATGQLIEWRSPDRDVYEIIEYNPNLNRKSKQTETGKSFYTTNSLYEYIKHGNFERFTYDLNGNLFTKSKLIGTTEHVEQFSYDPLGRCANITTEKLTCRYQYNVFGAVSSKNCSNGYNTKYLVDPFGTYGTSIIAEQTETRHMSIYHGQEHGLIVMMESADPHDAVFYIFDGDGSTIQTASHAGEILLNYVYDPFGRQLLSSMDDGNLFRFLGQYGIQIVNETAGIVFIRNRMYDSEHGRFMSPDPTGVFGSPTNPYSYASNNPLMFKDTNGKYFFVAPLVKYVLYTAAEGAFVEGIKAADKYIFETAVSKDKTFNWRDLAVTTGKAAVKGGIMALNPFDSQKSKYITSVLATLSTGGNLLEALTSENPFTSRTSRFAFNFLGSLAKGGNLLDALESGATDSIPEKYRPFYSKFRYVLDELVKQNTNHSNLTDLCQDCFMRWVRSIDPNEMTGPVGYGDANYISADQSLLYKIEFENNPNATAPAQKVIIRCPIDSNLELGTFKVGLVKFDVYEKDFEFRSSRVPLSRVDATDKTGTFVEIQVFIDPRTNEAVWLLQSIDPLTGLPPSNPLIGFLPPNNGTDGQGYVTFSVDLKSSVQSLTKITENASIVFDENPHIDTSTIFHTVDKTAGTVSINVSTLFGGGVLFNLITEDVGSVVRSVDLYLVVDGSVELIKSDINQSVVVVELSGNVLHTIVGVATDNVGNIGTMDNSQSVDIYVPAECPANCSGRGQCGTGGVCICDSGYGGFNCSLNVTMSCEPPILEVSHSDSVRNESLVVFVSARSSQPEPAASISVKISCQPNDTVISKGRQQSDGVYLVEADFGNVVFNAPDWFSGLLVCTIKATVVDVCGSNIRAVLLAVHVVAPADLTTVRTDTVSMETAVRATDSTDWRDVTTDAMIPVTAVTDSHRPTSGDRTLSAASMTVTNVAVTQVSGPGDGTTTSTIWGDWSDWTPCSRSCDYGVQERTRQCLLLRQGNCGSSDTDRRFCRLSTCPGILLSNNSCHVKF